MTLWIRHAVNLDRVVDGYVVNSIWGDKDVLLVASPACRFHLRREVPDVSSAKKAVEDS
jgi:hypothetical protein